MAHKGELEVDMAAVDGVLLVLRRLAGQITASWTATTSGDDPDDLHDLRRAIRRTRVVLDNSRSVLPPRFVDEARHSFAGVAAVTGASRDLDTLTEKWETYLERLDPDEATLLMPVPPVLLSLQTTARLSTVATLRHPRLERVVEAWPIDLALVPKRKSQGRNAERQLHWLVRRKLESSHDVVLDGGRAIDKRSSDTQLHDLRKDTKTLRYLVDAYASLLPKGPRNEFLRSLKVLQNNLGAHQDATAHQVVVQQLLVAAHRAGESAATVAALQSMRAAIDQVAAETRKQFRQCFDVYDDADTRKAFKEMQRRIR